MELCGEAVTSISCFKDSCEASNRPAFILTCWLADFKPFSCERSIASQSDASGEPAIHFQANPIQSNERRFRGVPIHLDRSSCDSSR